MNQRWPAKPGRFLGTMSDVTGQNITGLPDHFAPRPNILFPGSADCRDFKQFWVCGAQREHWEWMIISTNDLYMV